ncbi:PET112 family, C terminal region domain-containing protein [Toxoplasma gondii RUB]|uniref:PET112 family, C terminal region domain-containing protein n=1 Tax=Toxoplasma gondii RUB TaxID=935652 RepID=A0A086M4W7_TOXGO|nr:PET112 family, C terminal region domain-containing protein [Toxoplasma gondii RUB]
MRSKFASQEYFPVRENLIPPIAISKEDIERLRQSLPESPSARQERYVTAMNLCPNAARVLVRDSELFPFFEAAVAAGASPVAAAAWLLNEVAGCRKRLSCSGEKDEGETKERLRDDEGEAASASAVGRERNEGRDKGAELETRLLAVSSLSSEATDAPERPRETAETSGKPRVRRPARRSDALPLKALKLTPEKLAEMLLLIERGALTHNAAKQLLPDLLLSWDGTVEALVAQRNLKRGKRPGEETPAPLPQEPLHDRLCSGDSDSVRQRASDAGNTLF